MALSEGRSIRHALLVADAARGIAAGWPSGVTYSDPELLDALSLGAELVGDEPVAVRTRLRARWAAEMRDRLPIAERDAITEEALVLARAGLNERSLAEA